MQFRQNPIAGRAGSHLPAGRFRVYGWRRVPHMRDAPYLTLYASGVKDWSRSFWSAVLQHRFRFD